MYAWSSPLALNVFQEMAITNLLDYGDQEKWPF
jgi:hypothetical protein